MRSLCIIYTEHVVGIFLCIYPNTLHGVRSPQACGCRMILALHSSHNPAHRVGPPTKPTNLIHALVPELATFMCRRKSTQELPPRTRPRKTRVADLQDNPPIIHTEVYIRQTRTAVFTETDPSLLFDSRRTWTMTTRRLQYDRPT